MAQNQTTEAEYSRYAVPVIQQHSLERLAHRTSDTFVHRSGGSVYSAAVKHFSTDCQKQTTCHTALPRGRAGLIEIKIATGAHHETSQTYYTHLVELNDIIVQIEDTQEYTSVNSQDKMSFGEFAFWRQTTKFVDEIARSRAEKVFTNIDRQHRPQQIFKQHGDHHRPRQQAPQMHGPMKKRPGYVSQREPSSNGEWTLFCLPCKGSGRWREPPVVKMGWSAGYQQWGSSFSSSTCPSGQLHDNNKLRSSQIGPRLRHCLPVKPPTLGPTSFSANIIDNGNDHQERDIDLREQQISTAHYIYCSLMSKRISITP
ncbi:hypothetical protein NPIL_622951 [Nephila pilipes]|uniref:Uncharacterized protein n=1 Tax=Nephila pilipes TaxID=299642 RepID=A0A8X6MWV5_NEPPI|nr:hypothetical protein NPIL_622951 [Nephila pilipes]